MLSSLFIQNIALIESLTVNLNEKLNIFSGETGAGKSIIIDSINFMLGAKADKSLIRHGKESAVVEGMFDIQQRDDVKDKLNELNIPNDDNILISRMMTNVGKNEIRINGKQVTLTMLREISHLLVDVHGQSEHFMLSKVSTHIDLLDKFGGESIAKRKSEFAIEYSLYVDISKQLNSFGGTFEERERLIDLYTFQINEIEDANLSLTEEDELSERFKLITNIEKIATTLSGVLEVLSGDEGALSLLGTAKQQMYPVESLNDFFPDIAQRIASLEVECDDVSSSISDYLGSLNFDEREADKIADRLELIKKLKRKYGRTIEDIFEYLEKTKAEQQKLINADEEITRLNAEKIKIISILEKKGEELTLERKKTAERFQNAILSELADLGMKDAKFEASFLPVDFIQTISKNGVDNVEFMFSANLGEPMKPLIKVISGGEMSRFMLALKSITLDLDNIPTMIFDEIDTGISGQIAHVVAEKFIMISREHQVIVITHLPQIAATGDENFLIQKNSDGQETKTSIYPLSGEEVLIEIARLSGSVGFDDLAKSHAQNLKARFDDKKN